MKTGSKFSRLCGWSARCATAALALAFCASAFADPSKNVIVTPTQQFAQSRVIKICYVKTIASGIPLRCERLYGTTFPTTANPLQIIGREPQQ
jgi:hypothetical protein